VQYWLRDVNQPLPANDPHFTKAPWQDAQIVPFDGSGIAGFKGAPLHPAQFDPVTRKPREWPLRHTLCRWTAKPLKIAPASMSCAAARLMQTEPRNPCRGRFRNPVATASKKRCWRSWHDAAHSNRRN
jgi:hypothetical protein